MEIDYSLLKITLNWGFYPGALCIFLCWRFINIRKNRIRFILVLAGSVAANLFCILGVLSRSNLQTSGPTAPFPSLAAMAVIAILCASFYLTPYLIITFIKSAEIHISSSLSWPKIAIIIAFVIIPPLLAYLYLPIISFHPLDLHGSKSHESITKTRADYICNVLDEHNEIYVRSSETKIKIPLSLYFNHRSLWKYSNQSRP